MVIYPAVAEFVKVDPPDGVDHVPSPRRYVVELPPLGIFAIGKLPLTAVAKLTLPHEGATPAPPEMRTLPVAASEILESVVAALAYSISPTV